MKKNKTYAQKWKTRKWQLIISGIISAVISVLLALEYNNLIAGLAVWAMLTYFGAALAATVVAAIASTAPEEFAEEYESYDPKTSNNVTEFFIILLVSGIIMIFELIAFPFTTIYYYVKAKKETVQVVAPTEENSI